MNFKIAESNFGTMEVAAVLGTEATIMPGREHFVDVVVLADRKDDVNISMFGGAMTDNPHLRVANSVSVIDDDWTVALISNMGQSAIHLFAGEPVGHIELLSEKDVDLRKKMGRKSDKKSDVKTKDKKG